MRRSARLLLPIPAISAIDRRLRKHLALGTNVAAQRRVVSVARIRLDSRKSVRPFKGRICDDISEFESSLSGRVGVKHFQTAPSMLVSMPLAGSSLLFGIGTLALP
jgi:hypothetical protein